MKYNLLNIKNVFAQRRYFFFLFGISLTFFVFNVIFKNTGAIKNMFSIGVFSGFVFLINLIIGFKETVPLYTFISVILISLLTGLLFTIIVYKVVSIRKINSQLGIFGTIGVFLGVFIPGCAACSIGALGVLGITGPMIALLPLKVFELQVISMVFLSLGILYFSNNLSNSCSLDYNGKNRKNKIILN